MRFLRLFLTEMKRTVFSLPFLFSILLIFAGFAAGSFKELFEFLGNTPASARGQLDFARSSAFFIRGAESDAAHFFLPLAAALPSGMLFIEDMSSGFIKGYVSRSGRINYVAVRCLTSAAAAVLAALIGVGLFYRLSDALVSPFFAPPPPDYPMEAHRRGIGLIFRLYAASAVLWSSFGLLISGLTVNRFSAAASPFLAFYLTEILSTQFFRRAEKLKPSNYLFDTGLFQKPITPAVIGFVGAGALLACFAAVSWLRIRRQV